MSTDDACGVRTLSMPHRRERGLRAVVALTAAMMVVEIVAGYATHSMALLADGWHMATHVAALGLSAAAYAVARRFAQHRAFVFGTGKVQSLAGYTSALLLGIVALSMAYESVSRLLTPKTIDFATSLPVAIVGLLVNLLSVRLLHTDEEHVDEHQHEHGHGHGHGHGHDHNHRAALMHVIADALTSGLAIVALLAGRSFGVTWLDPATGIVGGIVILKWAFDLCRNASHELLDLAPNNGEAEERIRSALAGADVTVTDLHVWSVGSGKRCGVVTLTSAAADLASYRARILAACELCHLTVEVRGPAQK